MHNPGTGLKFQVNSIGTHKLGGDHFSWDDNEATQKVVLEIR